MSPTPFKKPFPPVYSSSKLPLSGLNVAGVTTPEKLAQKRPYIIVGAFVVGMLLTPPDVISQTLLALPMWLLFEVGIFFSRKFVRRRETEEPSIMPETAAAGAGAASVHAEEEDYRDLSSEEMDAELDRIEDDDAGTSASDDTQKPDDKRED